MTKHFCDICGKEMPWLKMCQVRVGASPDSTMKGCIKEACQDCAQKIKDLFQNVDEESLPHTWEEF